MLSRGGSGEGHRAKRGFILLHKYHFYPSAVSAVEGISSFMNDPLSWRHSSLLDGPSLAKLVLYHLKIIIIFSECPIKAIFLDGSEETGNSTLGLAVELTPHTRANGQSQPPHPCHDRLTLATTVS
jgi:hypothetical protein